MITNPALAKHTDFKKFIRVLKGAHPTFHVKLSGPCDYVNGTRDLIRQNCSQTINIGYRP